MAVYKLSPAAEEDLVAIFIRGLGEWGLERADNFQNELISTFHLLAQQPGIGREVSILPTTRRHEVLPYVVFYTTEPYGVRIVRILYKNRAMEKHL